MQNTILQENVCLSALTLVTAKAAPSVPTTLANFAARQERRARLVHLLRRAFVAMTDANEAHQNLWTALVPDTAALAASEARCKHVSRRYNALETVLAEESGLPKFSIFNSISTQYPLVSRLLRSGL